MESSIKGGGFAAGFAGLLLWRESQLCAYPAVQLSGVHLNGES